MYQINEDHDFLNQLLDDVLAGSMSFLAADSDSQKDSLVGCIGKRDLDSFDYSKRGYRLMEGDSLILCTDGAQPDEQSLWEAAVLAAYYSQGRESSKVPVDYTPVKLVKKPAGGRPGMVIYTTYQTVNVTPKEEEIQALRVK